MWPLGYSESFIGNSTTQATVSASGCGEVDETMKGETLVKCAALLAIGAAAGVLLVALIDPACGPTGKEQAEWIQELMVQE